MIYRYDIEQGKLILADVRGWMGKPRQGEKCMSGEKKSGLDLQQVLDELRKPFHPSQITWKPGAVKGERALALAYADLRAYMNRLDDVCGSDWSVAYEPWGEDRIICRLTILGVTRSSTGETTNESERSDKQHDNTQGYVQVQDSHLNTV